MKKTLVVCIIMLGMLKVNAQNVIPLYPNGVPNSTGNAGEETKTVTNGSIRYGQISKPSLEIWLPPAGKASGAAIVICPGGGYSIVSYTNEGTSIAEAFNKMGVAAFILKYRMPSDISMKDKTIGPLQDAQTAIKIVRQRAKEWGVDTARVGIIGFSAGGHLASTAGTHFNKAVIDNKEGISLRPDFMILGYPVINLTDSLMHQGSRTNLLGTSPPAELVTLYSNDLQVTKRTPPTLLFHAGDDKTVKVANSIRFYESLLRNGVPAELHLYPKGGHGFGLYNKTTSDLWIERVENWMKAGGWIK
ncbi:alpha/beta hydrolase [Hufsiella ginkgonis]|uniref:Alpha/beta hydrolase fold domain-containing protein n=1 Tax=Hufsiella ginkgonis TaxID=2695274 RepID=A0A7K1Y3S6_9SPHI|nr:alpha/beta hydrolase [Hufsiella ginkgonis]MXV17768.1 alpha/beta hydrolase fold domain-containing protein [Hufsiella ginkgonis]